MGPYSGPHPQVIFMRESREEMSMPSVLALSNLEEEGYYSPRDRYLNKNELRSVLKNLAKFHADGIKFLRETKLEFPFLKAEETRKVATRRLIDRFLQPYLQFLEQFTPVQPAVLLLN